MFSPFNVEITTTDPAPRNHFEIMIAGQPTDLGMRPTSVASRPAARSAAVPEQRARVRLRRRCGALRQRVRRAVRRGDLLDRRAGDRALVGARSRHRRGRSDDVLRLHRPPLLPERRRAVRQRLRQRHVAVRPDVHRHQQPEPHLHRARHADAELATTIIGACSASDPGRRRPSRSRSPRPAHAREPGFTVVRRCDRRQRHRSAEGRAQGRRHAGRHADDQAAVRVQRAGDARRRHASRRGHRVRPARDAGQRRRSTRHRPPCESEATARARDRRLHRRPLRVRARASTAASARRARLPTDCVVGSVRERRHEQLLRRASARSASARATSAVSTSGGRRHRRLLARLRRRLRRLRLRSRRRRPAPLGLLFAVLVFTWRRRRR